MIRPEELRIRNLFYISVNDGPREVHGVRGSWILYFDGDEIKPREVNQEYCQPIPITEDWLIKFGFEYFTKPIPADKNPFHFNNEYDFYRYGNIELQSHFVSYNDKTIALRVNADHVIYHVHTLQNFFYAHGSDLTIKKEQK